MKRASDDHASSSPTKKVKQNTPVYAVLVVFLSGDDDYGALIAKDYGEENIFQDILNKREKEHDDFNYRYSIYEYQTKKDREDALQMMLDATNHVGDYDHRKHDDIVCRALSEKEYALYCESTSSSDESSFEEWVDDESDDTERCAAKAK
jgi:hypothetical protein